MKSLRNICHLEAGWSLSTSLKILLHVMVIGPEMYVGRGCQAKWVRIYFYPYFIEKNEAGIQVIEFEGRIGAAQIAQV